MYVVFGFLELKVCELLLRPFLGWSRLRVSKYDRLLPKEAQKNVLLRRNNVGWKEKSIFSCRPTRRCI